MILKLKKKKSKKKKKKNKLNIPFLNSLYVNFLLLNNKNI